MSDDASVFDDLLAANARYAEGFRLAGLEPRAARGLAVLTCIDSRIEPLAMLGLAPGDAKIPRNAGARVTDDMLRTLVLSVWLLGVDRIAIVHHTNCRMVGVTDDALRATISSESGADASLEQKAKQGSKKRDKRRATERAKGAATKDDDPGADDASNADKQGSVNSSAKAGKTKCTGNRERCRARPGKVEVTDDCDGDGTCTIDIRADGGSAECDASGGEKDRAGNGDSRRPGGATEEESGA